MIKGSLAASLQDLFTVSVKILAFINRKADLWSSV